MVWDFTQYVMYIFSMVWEFPPPLDPRVTSRHMFKTVPPSMKQENVTDLIMIENENVAVTKPYGNVASSVASGTVIPSGHQGFRKKSKNKNVNVN